MQSIPLLTSAHLLAQLPDAALIADTTGRIQWWNDAAAELYGWATLEVAGRTLADVAPLPPPRNPDHSPQRWECEVIHRHRSGSPLPVAVSAQRLYRDDGAPIGTVALIRPRPTSTPVLMHAAPGAASREASDALRKRAQNLQALIDSVDVLFWSVDTRYQVIAANAAFRRAVPSIGRALAQADGPSPTEETPGDMFAALRTWYDRAFAGQETYVELPLHIAQQADTFECSVTPLRAPDGTITGASVFAQDVATWQRTAAAARDTQNKLGTLFEFLPVGVAIINADGEITYTNREHQRIAPGAYDHLEGGQPLRLGYLRPDGTPRPRSEFASVRALQERQPVIAQETGIVDTNGVVHWVSITSVPVEMPDWRVVTVLTDITARKEAEAAVQSHAEILDRVNAQLNHALRLKDEFLATMSHELRTPLNAILGYSESLQGGIYGSLSAAQLRPIRAIERAGQHLLSLINDILDLAKVEAGQMAFQVERVLANDICQESISLVWEAALKKHQRLDVHLDRPQAVLEVDPVRLKQMLVNLLANAVKFTPAGGQVGLEMRTDSAASTVHFTVYDTGVGIAPDDIGRLFNPFSQLDSTLSREYEGTGLGLALVRRFAELHGGNVTVESELGKGSRFTIILPSSLTGEIVPGELLPAPAIEAEGSLTADVETVRGRILLADDNQGNVGTIVEYLQAKGYQVTVAENGHEALAQAEAVRPQLMLMDIQMPGIDGLEAIRQLRALPAFAATPIIAVSALALSGDEERCLEAGATKYLAKPVRLRALAELIHELIAD